MLTILPITVGFQTTMTTTQEMMKTFLVVFGVILIPALLETPIGMSSRSRQTQR